MESWKSFKNSTRVSALSGCILHGYTMMKYLAIVLAQNITKKCYSVCVSFFHDLLDCQHTNFAAWKVLVYLCTYLSY